MNVRIGKISTTLVLGWKELHKIKKLGVSVSLRYISMKLPLSAQYWATLNGKNP